ncbi:VOC family protein [Kitasatospora sp. NPDC092948]|uniref:VOC family protein n=1 Tax=Kitasatospora sp. NPDC092948 TaxID=3364088 RepID=UPI00382D9469
MADGNSVDATSTGNAPVPVWFDLSTPDAAQARKFYQDLFGWQINVLDETYSLVSGTNAPPTGGIGQSGPGAPYTGMCVYFPVDDVEAALAQAEKLGATRLMEPNATPLGTIAAFRDLDGNVIGLKSA